MIFSVVIVAAGASTRAGPGRPKPLRSLGGRAVLLWSVEALDQAGAREIILVTSEDQRRAVTETLSGFSRCRLVNGGATRAQSVRAGLAALNATPDEAVLIHDAARPFVTSAHVQSLLKGLQSADGAIPALPVADTLKRATGHVPETVSREGLWRAQTPQAFRFGQIVAAYATWPEGGEPTDDSQVLETAGGSIALIPGDPMLMKLTYPEDFAMAERLVEGRRITRTGLGVDAHRWGPGEAVWLCGVKIDHDQALVGHSDADAGLHALTDAILGAIGAGDIGEYFPPTDPQWRGASSDQFLRHAVGLVAARGGVIINVDITLICERPKIMPHRQAMRARLADLLGLALDRVSVKATTTEGMGFTGRQEGLVAQAIASVEMPA